MKILITGGAGFIGSHIVDQALEAGHEVYVADHLPPHKKKNINPSAKYFDIDITHKDALIALFKTIKPDVVNHHASQVSVSASVKNPQHDALTNCIGTLNVLEAAHEAGAKKIIFASSGGAIYGNKKSQVPRVHLQNPFLRMAYPNLLLKSTYSFTAKNGAYS